MLNSLVSEKCIRQVIETRVREVVLKGIVVLFSICPHRIKCVFISFPVVPLVWTRVAKHDS